MMSDKRISGWFVLSGVFIVAVFGLFFTFTERKTWPEQRIELSATDMRLIPPTSTLWCEAVALNSDHPFIAYQVNRSPIISPKHLSRQKFDLQLKLGTGKSSNYVRLKYFLLPSSVVELVACSTSPGARILVFKGDEGVQDCVWDIVNKEYESATSEDESDENTSEEIYEDYPETQTASGIFTMLRKRESYKCSSLMTYHRVDPGFMGGMSVGCLSSVELLPVHVNVTAPDYYVFVVLNTNRKKANQVGLRLLLDRSRYTVQKSGQTFDMCSLATFCTIGLGFGSSDRALVWIPEEPNAGRSSFIIRSRCKPRLALFAILSVFLPLMAFLVIAFVVRADRDRIRRIYTCRCDAESEHQQRFSRPLLDNDLAVSSEAIRLPGLENHEIADVGNEELPPPYHTLYDPPPPYACVKEEGSK